MRRTALALVLFLLVPLGRTAGGEESKTPEGETKDTIEPSDLPEPTVPDAMQLYTLDQVVVVYPAGPGEDVEKNRVSAERRARFLEKVRGVHARAVADDRVGEQERAGNLVLLGWNNRVLGSEAAPRPFSHASTGITFLGLEHPDPLADLMFYSYSPFRKGKFLFFWSRIDPEMDRLQTLPWVGSNWAILRDFLVVRQGMFQGKSAWPPARNPEAEVDHTASLDEIETVRAVRRSEHYDIYYIPSDTLEQKLDAIVQARESAFARAASALGKPPEGFRIRLFVYTDEKDKEERTGVKDPAHSIPQRRELYLVERLARNAACHEEIHLIARQLLGPCTLTSLYEGLALSEDGTYGGTELDVYGAVFLEKGQLPTLDELLQEDRTLSLPEKVTFPASGLLGGWLRSLGPDPLRRAYTMSGEGVDALAKAVGKPASSLESSFKEWVKERSRAHASDVVFLKEQAAAQERYLAGDYLGVAAALERALKAKPDDPQTLFNLASAQARTGAYEQAEKNLKRILARELPKRDAHLAIFSHYQLGRLYDIQGRREAAVEEYRRVLELPDQKDAHRLASEALEKPVTKDDLE